MAVAERTREVILSDMLGLESPRKILLVDKTTMRIMSSACRMYDVLQQGVTVVEDVTINRQPLPFDAIYFLSPTETSVERLLTDFDPKKKKKVQYPRVHLFFNARIDDKLLAKIQDHYVSDRIKTLKELHVDWLAVESQAFHFDSPDSFQGLFSPSGDPEITEYAIAKRLVSLCIALGEYPTVRYARSQNVAGRLASTLQNLLEGLPKSYSKALSKTGKGFTLLILDRKFDPMTPLLHEFTYQAMIYDLIKDIEDNCYTYEYTTDGEKKGKESTIR